MSQEIGPLARELALPYYDAALPAHDRFHARRVRDLARRLSEDCDRSVDTDVLSAAAWFHDIGRPLERSGEVDDHNEWAASEVESLLEPESISEDRIGAITHCLRTHSIRASSPDPATLEAKLLFDADKLDATGAIGVVRLSCIVGERSGRAGDRYAVLDDPSVAGVETTAQPDIFLLRDWARERLDELQTRPGRRLGDDRWQFMEAFFAQVHSELGIGEEE